MSRMTGKGLGSGRRSRASQAAKGPLRRVLGEVPVYPFADDPNMSIESREFAHLHELYECGHTAPRKEDAIGPTNAYRRRCFRCRDGIAPKPDYLKAAQEWEKKP